MVRPISSDLRQRVLELYLSALSRQEISDMTGVATGSVSNIMDDERGRTPDIDALREVSRALRKRNISWVDAARGSTLLDRLDQIGLSFQKVTTAVGFYEKYGKRAPEVLGQFGRVSGLQTRYGKRIEDIVEEAARLARGLEADRKTVSNLRDEERRLEESISDLNELAAVQSKLSLHRLTIPRLDDFIERSLGL